MRSSLPRSASWLHRHALPVRDLRLRHLLWAAGATTILVCGALGWALPSLAGLWTLIAVLTVAIVLEFRNRADAERAAKESLHRYHRLADHSFDMMVSFDPRSQQRTYVSPSCRRLYGYEPEEALALSAQEIIHPDDFPEVQAAAKRAEQGDQTPVVYRGRRKDGTYIWVEASLTPSTNPATGDVEIVSVVRDISERVRYQAELRAAKERADTASVTKSEFLAMVSHELRTPLNAIIGFADLMRQEVIGPIENEQYRSYVGDIYHSGTHLLSVINDILDLSKAEVNKLELNEEIVDAGEIVGNVIRLLSASIEAAGLECQVNVPADLPLLRVDELKIRQVIINLVGNAVKFTPSGGRIEVRAGIDAATGFTISVADSGIGISPENINRVFEPFAQINSPYNRRYQGTGLGLTLVKAIIELHQGEVALKSVVDVGTEVIVILPAERTVRRSLLPSAA